MSPKKTQNYKRHRRHQRVRAKIKGTNERPRLSVFRSNKHLWAQLIDDEKGVTRASAGDQELSKTRNKVKRIEFAHQLGILIAQKAADKKINKIVFDRGGYKYHGIVKAVAEGVREGGLKF